MAEVIILRHSDRDPIKDELTEEGKIRAASLVGRFQNLEKVIASPKNRTAHTALLSSGQLPDLDERADIIPATQEQIEEIEQVRQREHLRTSAEAIFRVPSLLEPAKRKGLELVSLIRFTQGNLSECGTALIVSHDGPMIAARKLLTGGSFEYVDRPYQPLEGFTVTRGVGYLVIGGFRV